ncbi:MAG: FAD-dependent oxidoreductase [Schleiferiaceae bacterium]|nr:FAD-dependent oxidoreductase [Schleiferiaceae bacterium]
MKIGIIGAGITGLTAANYLKEAGVTYTIFEKSHKVGGRVQTDAHDGFLLDHGFQVFLTGYPEAKRLLDYKALDLKPILPGALLLGEKKRAVWDVFRAPSKGFETLISGVASVKDMYLMWKLRNMVCNASVSQLLNYEETSTADYLKNLGFSSEIIDFFFKPFYSGIFLENELQTSNRMFLFVFKMFAESDTALPANGIQAIPNQLAEKLDASAIHLEESVLEIGEKQLVTAKASYSFDAIIDTRIPTSDDGLLDSCGTWNFYFSASDSPFKDKAIALNTRRQTVVNNICVVSDIAPNYAPKGKSLISISVILNAERKAMDEATVLQAVQTDLNDVLPESVRWQFIKAYKIPHALPKTEKLKEPIASSFTLDERGVIVASDYQSYGSLNAAMHTGRLAAEHMLATL